LANYLERFDPRDRGDRKIVLDALERAVELGITYYDTAPSYGDGIGEELFGSVLSGLEQEIFLATKVRPLDADGVRKSVEASLKRLGRSSIDLLQIHGGSTTHEQLHAIMKEDGTLDGMKRLQREGVVRYVGFTSEDNNDSLYRCIHSDEFDAVQIMYNLLFQHPYEASRPFGSLLEAEKRNMGIVAMRPATSGMFQKWMRMVQPDNPFDYTEALIQFVLSNPYIDVAIIGMRDPAIVEKNVQICDRVEGRIDLDELYRRYV
jgi:aryl-alcohol dehydrogenase-like predicted oxidoreductase